MPSIAAVATALPPYTIEQADAKRFAESMFGEAFGSQIERLIPVYDNADIERRHFCVPLDWFAEASTFGAKNDLYIDSAIDLSTIAIERCLNGTGYGHEDIDYIVFVSTTGLSTPSIDAQLLERLPFRRNIKRLPIWGLGCAGGASSISRAMDIARGLPSAKILVVIVELCGLTFMRNDLSKSALIASSLFGDGAAAMLVLGDDYRTPPHAPQLLASYTTTLPDSLEVMGWKISEDGFRVVISRDIPTIVGTFMRESIEEFLGGEGLALPDIEHYIAHPGGAKVIAAYEESLGISPCKLRHTRDVLRDCGNISACSVVFVLERFMCELASRAEPPRGEHGLLCALGPGFSAEQVLVRFG